MLAMTADVFLLVLIQGLLTSGQLSTSLTGTGVSLLDEAISVGARYTGDAATALRASLSALQQVSVAGANAGHQDAVGLTTSAIRVVSAAIPAVQLRARQVTMPVLREDFEELLADATKAALAASKIAFLVANAANRANVLLAGGVKAPAMAAVKAQRQATIAYQNALIAYQYVDHLAEALEKRRVTPPPPIFF